MIHLKLREFTDGCFYYCFLGFDVESILIGLAVDTEKYKYQDRIINIICLFIKEIVAHNKDYKLSMINVI